VRSASYFSVSKSSNSSYIDVASGKVRQIHKFAQGQEHLRISECGTAGSMAKHRLSFRQIQDHGALPTHKFGIVSASVSCVHKKPGSNFDTVAFCLHEYLRFLPPSFQADVGKAPLS
jgi:hypothetical protein